MLENTVSTVKLAFPNEDFFNLYHKTEGREQTKLELSNILLVRHA
jgi:hypothetical protein